MSKGLRTVLVGCGGISKAWMGSTTCQEGVEIVGVVDLRPEAAHALCEKYGLGEEVVTGADLATVLAVTKPEAVFDLTVPEAHGTVVCTALAHGCHVLGEKPMAATLDEGRRMVAAAAAADRIYAVTQTRRYNRHMRRLQAFLDSGAIGAVHTVHADFFISIDFGGFRAAMDHVLLLDMAIHSFDTARVLTPGRPVRVLAEDWNPPASWYRHGASAWAAFTMDGGQRFTYRGSWTATGAQTSWECSWRIFGEQGAVTWDGAEGLAAQCVVDAVDPASGKVKHNLMDVEVPPFDPPHWRGGHDGAIAEFLACVREGRRPETVADDNILSLAMVHGAMESAETGGRPMTIADGPTIIPERNP